ncbi:hypothetical protein [Streptomyces pactum]|uniref:Uncharacterized protein n=1 Tax=Streptomyces pactum TaxID=68249 RepID=A0A1S6JBE0_9ACTN|nr:hypothetical protein [Streptomyces pactum]AQS69049.1 hypothetical protein B1H29_20945 [Streptomyces pactum]
MTEPIGRLITWMSLLLTPRGAHRRTGPHPAACPTPRHPAAIGVVPLPTHRSPYGLPAVLDGTATVAVRPYVLAHTPYELEAAA